MSIQGLKAMALCTSLRHFEHLINHETTYICDNIILFATAVHERFDVAKLMNMDYSNDVQKKLVDKIAAQLPSDDAWDESDEWQKAYKSVGLKRFKIDKQLMGTVHETETHAGVIESSSSKDAKGPAKLLFEPEDSEVKIKIQNPEYQELQVHMRTSSSAAVAMSTLQTSLKTMLPKLVVLGASGLNLITIICLCSMFIDLFALLFPMPCEENQKLHNASNASRIWTPSTRSCCLNKPSLSSLQQMMSMQLMR